MLFNANSIHHSYNKCICGALHANLCSRTTFARGLSGHLFYQEVGDEEDITFQYNLGLGAMSHNFDIHAQRKSPTTSSRSAITPGANPGKVTATAHGYNNGDTIYVSGVAGMTQVNDQSFTMPPRSTREQLHHWRQHDRIHRLFLGRHGEWFSACARAPARYQLIEKYWWPGDHMARLYGPGENYFGLNVPNHDNQLNPTHGACRDPLPTGDLSAGWYPSQGNTCKPTQYSEPASGFWIVNPVTRTDRQLHRRMPGRRPGLLVAWPKTASNTGKPDWST